MKRNFRPLLSALLLGCLCFALPSVAGLGGSLGNSLRESSTVNHGSQFPGATRYNKARISLSGVVLPLPEGKANTMSKDTLVAPGATAAPATAPGGARDTDGTPLSSVPIIGRGPQPMAPPSQPQLVTVLCDEEFSHMWGEPTQTNAGQAHIGADGVLMEPPGIASALLRVCLTDPKTNERKFIFKAGSAEDLQIVADFERSRVQSPGTGEDFGRLVRIECPTLAGSQTQTRAGTTIEFDNDGFAVTGEKIYQAMRPAFRGDGTSDDKDNPHEIYFHGPVETESELDGLQAALDRNSIVDVVDPNPAAAQFADQFAESLTPNTSATPGTTGDDGTSDTPAPLDTPDTPATPDTPQTPDPLAQRLADEFAADKVQLLSGAGLSDKASLQAALSKHEAGDANAFPRGFGPASISKLQGILAEPPAEPSTTPQS